MTKTQKDFIEGAGFFLVLYGLIWWLNLPVALIAVGVLCIVVGNCGKADKVDSTKHPATQ